MPREWLYYCEIWLVLRFGVILIEILCFDGKAQQRANTGKTEALSYTDNRYSYNIYIIKHKCVYV